MMRFLRYALATFCIAASIGCLALWGLIAVSGASIDIRIDAIPDKSIMIELQRGCVATMTLPGRGPLAPPVSWEIERGEPWFWNLSALVKRHGVFGVVGPLSFFPLWYPALIFALAGVASLRLGRRFTLRSAIIATMVVAGLLG
jgi:hypothetical protein